MAKSQFRITINVNGTPCRLASIGISPHGDLYLAIRTGDQARQLGRSRQDLGYGVHGQQVNEQRLSIHPSTNSPDKNRLNLHFVAGQQRVMKFATETEAIKSKDGFVFLYSRRGVEPRAAAKSLKGNARNFSLGSYDENSFTIHTTVFVSAPEVEMSTRTRRGVNVTSFVLGNFRITVLWSFYPIVGPPTGASVLLGDDPRDEKISHIMQAVSTSEDEAIATHVSLASLLSSELLDVIFRYLVFTDETHIAVFRKTYERRYELFCDGTGQSLEYKLFIQRPEPLLHESFKVLVIYPE